MTIIPKLHEDALCEERYQVRGLQTTFDFRLYIQHGTGKAFITCNKKQHCPIFKGTVSAVYNAWFDIVGVHPRFFDAEDWYEHLLLHNHTSQPLT